MNFFSKQLKNLFRKIKPTAPRETGPGIIYFNLALLLFQSAYIFLRYKYINTVVPLWFTKNWGDDQLAPKSYLYLIPLSCLVIILGSLFFELFLRKYFVRYLKETLVSFMTITNIFFTYALLKIIFSASTPFSPFISPLVLSLFFPGIIAFAATIFFLPTFIKYEVENDIVTNPKIHLHPGMVLQSPSARGGGTFYAGIFLAMAIIFVGAPTSLLGFYLAVLMLGVLGYIDDYQNTHVGSPFKKLETPGLRLILLFATVSVVVTSGVYIRVVGNPFAGTFNISMWSWLPYVFTLLWVVWILNLLSWSNGIDGQYCGIIGVASLFICVLALRFPELTPIHQQVAIMAAISAGIAFAFSRFTWYPSKIMWGFGATVAGLVVSTLSILINTKILISVLMLLIPFLDASVTLIRRIMQKKSPLKGDRGHFHHLLLDRGWSVPQIAIFYWLTTFLFGLVGLFSSERFLLQTVLTLGGAVAFIIVTANLKSLKRLPQ